LLALSNYDPANQVMPLDDMSRKILNDAVEALELVLNEISERLTGSSLHFRNVHTSGGASVLLHVLKEGLQAQAIREERWSHGDFGT
jgi:hypothetical protein